MAFVHLAGLLLLLLQGMYLLTYNEDHHLDTYYCIRL